MMCYQSISVKCCFNISNTLANETIANSLRTAHNVHVHESSEGLSSTSIPNPREYHQVPAQALPSQQKVQKVEPPRSLALRTRGGTHVGSSFVLEEFSLPTSVAHGHGH